MGILARWPCKVFLGCLLPAALAGCPKPAEQPDAGGCQFTLAWGRQVQGEFSPFTDGESAEITLGFQGFRYIDSLLAVDRAGATSVSIQFQIDVDGHDPYVQAPESFDVSAGYAQDVLVFFNDIPTPELVGRQASISARGTVDGCTGQYRATVTLADDENCLEAADGGLTCQDRDPPDAGTIDAGTIDGGTIDAGTIDAGPIDAAP